LPHRHKQRHRHSYPELSHGDLVHVVGTPFSFAAEIDRVPANIDHFWITLDTGAGEPIRLALSTHSRKNAAGGFDARMRVGIASSTWQTLPPAGLVKSGCLDYHTLEAASPVPFVEYERPALEVLLTQKTSHAILIEAWGELYVRAHLGIHQIHSMRASCSVPRDLHGRDGAIRFYYADARAELLLFKYCGQP
jgi:hypothetical protein